VNSVEVRRRQFPPASNPQLAKRDTAQQIARQCRISWSEEEKASQIAQRWTLFPRLPELGKFKAYSHPGDI
jgi:hypothetical protein